MLLKNVVFKTLEYRNPDVAVDVIKCPEVNKYFFSKKFVMSAHVKLLNTGLP